MMALRQTFTFALVLALTAPALAQETLSYQGHLADAARQPVNASYPFAFSLYADRAGGDALWTETYESIDVVDGVFTVELGSVTPFGDDLALNANLFLGIAVNSGDEMAPRVKVSSTLRARWAAHAKDVRGENIHPASVSIGDTEVINAGGQWVGDPAGLAGPAGPQGAVGAAGPQGEQGPAGPQGTPGVAGPAGVEGPAGQRGPAGVEGPQGPRGPQGIEGVPGARGPAGADGLQGGAGPAGRGITGINLQDGQLVITYSDGQVVNLGNVVGPAGAPGAQGAPGGQGIQGNPGQDGQDGADGSNGRGVANMQITDGDLVVSYSDGQEQNLGVVTGQRGTQGPQGPQGEPGANGLVGQNGAQGVGIDDVAIDGDGDLLVSLSNGDSINAGSIRDQGAGQTPLTNLFVESARSQNTPADVPRASNQGTDSILDIDYNGIITDISVVVDITHPDIAQLEVLLIAPNGASYILHEPNAVNESRANIVTIYPEQTIPTQSFDALIGQPASGRYILRVIDRDLGNQQAARRINNWGLNITRRADNAWRLPSNLIVDGSVDAETLCRIQQLEQNGQPVPGAITLTSGSQEPVRLTTFQCGNSQIDPAETCDDGNFDAGDGCDPRCLLECGNGQVDANETCDDGNLTATDECTDSCQIARCGDGIIWLGNETCDRGDENSNEPGANCRTDCTEKRCGDGIMDPGEECDDGNDVEDDGCTRICTAVVCGNGIIDEGETCDPGGAVPSICEQDCSARRVFETELRLDPGRGDGQDKSVPVTAPEDADGARLVVLEIDYYGEWDDTNRGTIAIGDQTWRLQGLQQFCDTEPHDFFNGARDAGAGRSIRLYDIGPDVDACNAHGIYVRYRYEN